MVLRMIRYQPHSRCPHMEHENGLWPCLRDSLIAWELHIGRAQEPKFMGGGDIFCSHFSQHTHLSEHFHHAKINRLCKSSRILFLSLFFFFFFLQTYLKKHLLDHSHSLPQLFSAEDILSQLANQSKPFTERGPVFVVFFPILAKMKQGNNTCF